VLEAFRDELLIYRGRSAQTWHGALEQLLAPTAAEVGDKDIVVLVPEGDLQLLPLHAASSFAKSSAVVYAPSFAALELARKQRPSEDRRLASVVTVGVAFPDEARAVSIAIGGACLSGRGVPKEKVRETVEGASIVHFACHGHFDQDDFRDSGLLLTVTDTPMRDDILSVRDLVEWRLDADLVVLSACETGVGKAAPSDFLGLGRAILAAGARAVVATLWPVDDRATQSLMLDFYAEMSRQGGATGWVNAATSLAAAQRRASETRPLYDWAGFKLIGWPRLEWSHEQ
jgi:CHAT domain